MKHSYKILRGGTIGALGRGFLMGVQFLSHLVLARSLGASDYGLLSLAIPIVLIGAFLARSGIPRSLQKFIPEYERTEDTCSTAGITRWSMQWLLILGTTASLVLILSAPLIEGHILKHNGLARTLSVVAISAVFMNVTSWFSALGVSLGQVRYEVLGEHVLQPLCFLLFLVGLLLIGGSDLSVTYAAIALSTSWALTAVVIWKHAAPLVRGTTNATANIQDRTKWRRFSLAATFPELVNRVRPWVDLLIAATLLRTEHLGILALCLRLSYIPSNILAAFGSIFVHQIGALHADRDIQGMREQYANVTYSALSISLPLICLLILLSPSIMSLFGQEYLAGAVVLVVLLAGQAIVAMLGPCWPMLLLTGSERELLRYSVASIVLSVVLCIALIPRFGVLGAGVSGAVSVAVLSVLQVIRLHRRFGVLPMRPWSTRLLPAVGLAVLAEVIRNSLSPISEPIANSAMTILTFLSAFALTSVIFGVWRVGHFADVLERIDRSDS